jgi:signal transduction histidine kinase
MSLRSKIVLILVTVVVAYAAIDNLTQRLIAQRSYGRWEREDAREDLARVRQRIDAELEDLVGKGRVFAGMPAFLRFVAADGGEEGAAELALGREIMDRAGVDLLYVCAPDGRVLWGSILDPLTREPRRLAEFPRQALAAQHPALAFTAGEERISGVYMTELHPLFLGTVPVAGPDGRLLEESGERRRRAAHGAIVLGRFLGPELERRIVQEELAVARAREGTGRGIELLESEHERVPPGLAGSDEHRLLVLGDDGDLHAYQEIVPLRTGSPLVLHVVLEREIDARRRLSINLALVSTLTGGLLVLFVLLRLLQRIVVAPLSTLTRKATEIGRRDDTTIRVGMQRPDEIGKLAGEFDRMLEKLAQSRAQVIQTARKAGMSEIATGVLHDVGNVLNSVNVAANLATKRTEDLAVADLEMLVGVLQQHERDLAEFVDRDPRGKHLIPLLKELSTSLGAQRRSIQEELQSLNQGIEHIAELVRAQQSFAGTKGVFERASLEEQVEAAVSICRQALEANPELEIVRAYEPLPPVLLDRHKSMEILVNLIQNAGQALAERGGPGQRLELRIQRHGEGTARVEVRDNGVGIAPENLTRVFQHGFTTKKGGHGFGLHVCANAATEMGAKLHAHSDGPGRGASFYLDIPLQEEAALAAA